MYIASQWLAQQAYTEHWQRMQHYAQEVAQRQAPEILWGCEHLPIYTTGKRAKDNRVQTHLPAPLITTDRGGETTFHGFGQLMLYPIIHLKQRKLSVRTYVHILEQSIITLLQNHHIKATQRCGFPGVWTEQGKIAALGIRIRRGVAYHGMALNVATNMHYFQAIQPCGLQAQAVNMSALSSHTPELPILFEQWCCIMQEQFHTDLQQVDT